MALLAKSSLHLSTRRATAAPRLAPLAPRARVVMRFRDNDDGPMHMDKVGAQHAPYQRLRKEYSTDQLTHTVAGQYEWQMIYMAVAGSFLILPFIPGFTIFAKTVYEAVGGQLN